MEKNNTFQYTYSAEEQGEILAIQKKYSSEKEPPGTLEELRQLNKKILEKKKELLDDREQ